MTKQYLCHRSGNPNQPNLKREREIVTVVERTRGVGVSAREQFLGDLRWVARFGLVSQISASQIEAPIGSLFQKYVSSTFMVKMRIDLGS